MRRQLRLAWFAWFTWFTRPPAGARTGGHDETAELGMAVKTLIRQEDLTVCVLAAAASKYQPA